MEKQRQKILWVFLIVFRTYYYYMKSLKEFIFNNDNIIDCHFHCFGEFGIIEPKSNVLLMVDNPTRKTYPLTKYFEENTHMLKKYPFLVIGCNSKETLDLYTKYSNCFGIGEIKVYKKHYPESEPNTLVEFEDKDFLIDILESNISKPIFIHYDLNKDNYKWLDDALTKYSNKTIVLCHCGISKLFDQDEAFEIARDLQQKHSNLFLDISWVALKYFLNNKHKLANLDNCRLLYGSDNNRFNQEYFDDMVKISKYINNKVNLEMLKEFSKSNK